MKLRWLEGQPKYPCGVTWGVPWKQGELNRENIKKLSLYNSKGESICTETWPQAFWPDGSIKWTGHSAVIQKAENYYNLDINDQSIILKENFKRLATDKDTEILINTEVMECIILKDDQSFIKEVKINGRTLSENGKLIAIKEKINSNELNKQRLTREKYFGKIDDVKIEQNGFIRSVIKIEGTHVSKSGSIIPFVIRLNFYKGLSSIKLVHTFFYDGNPQQDFIKGLGIEWDVFLEGAPWNRNVRFACEEGMFLEPSQLLWTRRYNDANGIYKKQIEGDIVLLNQINDKDFLYHVQDMAVWNDFKLLQDSVNHYSISKRTSEECAYITAVHGKKAKGLMYVGGEAGGLAVGIDSFFEKYPSSIQVEGLSEQKSRVQVWIWPPDVPVMDMRHYDIKTHVLSSYEGFDELRSTPYGIANTNEIFLEFYSSVPTNNHLFNLAKQLKPLLICEPEYYYKTRATGIWGLPDYSSKAKRKLEKRLELAYEFYKQEIDRRSWYGFWNFGDLMHTYDSVRHQWRYDIGGYAWQNTELVPNLWLWYYFFRTGRSDVFKMVEAMTKHNSEVDRYHFGEYRGLGSRHNVIHWGCGCKEARISMAGLFKYYYYLTCDERTGDLLKEVCDVDETVEKLDPMRKYYQNDSYSTHVRLGPEWSAFCSNWETEWERTENPIYLQKIMKGINLIKNLPLGLLSGPTFGYDSKKCELYHFSDANECGGSYHMVISFGAPQVWLELSNLLNDKKWDEMLVEFGEFYALPNEEKTYRTNGLLHDELFHWPIFATTLIAFAAAYKKDINLAQTAWKLLIQETKKDLNTNNVLTWESIQEVSWISTNEISQWCINTIAALELIGDFLHDF